MLRDEGNEMEQLDGLAAELTEAGRIARVASARREIPDPAFAARLRAELLRERPKASSAQAAVVPVPPARPLDSPEKLADRRTLNRPSVGGRRERAGESETELAAASAASAAPQESTKADRTRAGKRWRARQVETFSASPPGSTPDAEPADRTAADAGHLAALRPSVRWKMPTRALPTRWVALGLAASIAIASLLYGGTVLFPVRSTATADVAVATTLIRGGTSSPLAAGAELREGDEIKVAAGGQATLVMGGSFVRMAPGSDLRLDRLTPDHIVVDQIGGRVYHRASVGNDGNYSVITASVTWVASGTAFDLDRHSFSVGGEEVRGLALLDGLSLQGPQMQASLNQGESAVVKLTSGGSPESGAVIGQISAQVLADSWLVGNARLDYLAGLDLGELSVDVSPTPWPSRTPGEIANPTEPAGTANGTPTHKPTPRPTHKPTPRPTPRPTPTGPAYLGELTIARNGDGTYTFSWPKFEGDGFTYYELVYGPAGTQPVYPASPYWACNSGREDTSWTGAIDMGDYAVRLQVVDESSAVPIRAQTNTVHLNVTAPPPTLPPVESLGDLSVTNDSPNYYTFEWAPYTGGGAFGAYELVYVAWPGTPSYVTGAEYWAFGTGDTSSGSIEVPSGHWAIRVQAIGWPFGGDAFAFGESAVYELNVP